MNSGVIFWRSALSFFVVMAINASGSAQDTEQVPATVRNEPVDEDATVNVADRIDVDPANADEQIGGRLEEILEATEWFKAVDVKVDRGVVFIRGVSDTEAHRTWAEQTAMRTSDVVAVVNRLSVADKPFWNLTPAWTSLGELTRETTRLLPLVLIAFIVGILFFYLGRAGAKLTRWASQHTIKNGLLRQVSSNVVGVVVFIVGIYIALRVSGLTRLAVTLLGGTGLVGLALGFAFRDIAENYLASILISLNNPFRVGDLIEVGGYKGYVRKVTTRGTVMSTEDGNQIQIPNSSVYKGTIVNHTATPLTRGNFGVGIGFEDSITDTQSLVMKIFQDHTAVEKEPAPLVLVESLGSATVNMRCFYWFDQTRHSSLKVASSLIRQVKQVLTEAGITMPDEARELIFPHGVPVRMVESDGIDLQSQPSTGSKLHSLEKKRIGTSSASQIEDANTGEGDLSSEKAAIENVTKGEGAVADEANLLK